MPYYSTILKASSLPPKSHVSLDELLKHYNPHGLSLASLVSLLVRENALRWCLKWVPQGLESSVISIPQSEVEKRLLIAFSLLLEAIVAADIAQEELYDLIVIKHVLTATMGLVVCVQDQDKKAQLNSICMSLFEIHGTITRKATTEQLLQMDNTLPWILWAQAYLNLARNYFVPQGQEQLGKDEYTKCLDAAIAKFHQSISLAQQSQETFKRELDRLNSLLSTASNSPHAPRNKEFGRRMTRNRRKQEEAAAKLRAAKATQVEAHCGVAYATFLKARVTRGSTDDASPRRQLLVDAKKAFNRADGLSPSRNSTYNLACIAAQLNFEDEAKQWLEAALAENSLPRAIHINSDPDLANYREKWWFKKVVENQTAKDQRNAPRAVAALHQFDAMQQSTIFLADMTASFVGKLPAPMFSITGDEKPAESPASPPPAAGPSSGARQLPPGLKMNAQGEIDYGESPELNAIMNYDPEVNALQASLLREGFSTNTVVQMIKEVSKGKMQQQMDTERLKKQRERLLQRLSILNMAEKSVIPADGNCQMHSLSDQLFHSLNKSKDVRHTIVTWLKENGDWILPNGAAMHDFVHDRTWEEYCAEIARDGIWGDHLTLSAAVEIYEAKIVIVSSVEGSSYLTELLPTKAKVKRILYLSHYAEYHYGSLKSLNPEAAELPDDDEAPEPIQAAQ